MAKKKVVRYMALTEKTIKINAFKEAYKFSRENSNEIYKGFGFKHLSDATQYYVHPDNQSFAGTTTLCQAIGEAIILFATMLRDYINDKPIGDCFVSQDKTYLEINIPEEYRINGVVEPRVYKYCALFSKRKVIISAYDQNDNWIEGNMEHLHPLYKLLPFFMVLLVNEIVTISEFRNMMENFVEKPVADVFVNLHEDFYQAHKTENYTIQYEDVLPFDKIGLTSYLSNYKTIIENKKHVKKEVNMLIRFPQDEFTDEQKAYIPHLSEEFVLPKNLYSICNAVAAADMLAVLFHGPSGTGKTISCKLICQNIGLPIMETINCTENLDEFVLGKYIPQDDKIIFQESFVTRAIRDGGAVVFEEINFAKPQYLAFLNSLLDDNGFVRLDNGTVVKRHPNFRFFATMNMGYFGTKELNQALYNRFNGIVEIASLSDDAIKRMLIARVPECEPMVEKILGVYRKIKKKIESEELDIVISPRNLENWAKLAKYDGYITAAENTIIPIAKCDRTLEDTIRGILMLYKWY
ncbi:MAG: AAA family ATPase [Eubacteriales bacterium]|nr:AAA family ATPase [Eubacteriales bacterium]